MAYNPLPSLRLHATVLSCCALFILASCHPFAPRTPGVASGEPFTEYFTRPSSLWTHWDDPGIGGSMGIGDGGYRIKITQPNRDLHALYDSSAYPNARIAVLASKLDGPDNNTMGILCRFQDSSNHYAFLIGSDGYFGIVKVEAGEYTILNGPGFQYSPTILEGSGASNWIEAGCLGSHLMLMVNGELLVYVEDETFQDGKIGLTAGAFETPGVDIFFDEFSVSLP